EHRSHRGSRAHRAVQLYAAHSARRHWGREDGPGGGSHWRTTHRATPLAHVPWAGHGGWFSLHQRTSALAAALGTHPPHPPVFTSVRRFGYAHLLADTREVYGVAFQLGCTAQHSPHARDREGTGAAGGVRMRNRDSEPSGRSPRWRVRDYPRAAAPIGTAACGAVRREGFYSARS